MASRTQRRRWLLRLTQSLFLWGVEHVFSEFENIGRKLLLIVLDQRYRSGIREAGEDRSGSQRYQWLWIDPCDNLCTFRILRSRLQRYCSNDCFYCRNCVHNHTYIYSDLLRDPCYRRTEAELGSARSSRRWIGESSRSRRYATSNR
ncbi:hypothetical protein L596_024426 [Steinernema carpocapsae]|uniref:Uncharacterized protein n=1 Tax=Steinernema carpocapsae TaxID=34508 RepID=A0A4U5MGQ2_STECR|nr:hypothetical protein L596_024426 [Steinernema carpocapsae]